jgi:hypothetical protein
MTEPDEALIWARDDLAGEFDVYKPYYAALIRRGREDASLSASAHAYRAGQAASAERIKALEEALRNSATAMQAHLEAVDKYNQENGTFLVGLGMRLMGVRIAEARALLKEPTHD